MKIEYAERQLVRAKAATAIEANMSPRAATIKVVEVDARWLLALLDNYEEMRMRLVANEASPAKGVG